MAVSSVLPDYYAVLQVQPDAELEVIEAAYRQLMKKYHPDRAGDDPRRAQLHHQRAKAINEAFGVLRDFEQRRLYDMSTGIGRVRPRAAQAGATAGPSQAPANEPRRTPPPPQPVVVATPEDFQPALSPWLAPVAGLTAAYYLLPGSYEWEKGSGRELLSVLLVPPIGVGAFVLATGRLAPLIGDSAAAIMLAWGLLALMALPLWPMLPRLALAALPTGVLATGKAQFFLQQASVPTWLAWGAVSLLSLVFAARIYVFAVLPTVAICWLISRL
jgi:DnaJ domain